MSQQLDPPPYVFDTLSKIPPDKLIHLKAYRLRGFEAQKLKLKKKYLDSQPTQYHFKNIRLFSIYVFVFKQAAAEFRILNFASYQYFLYIHISFIYTYIIHYIIFIDLFIYLFLFSYMYILYIYIYIYRIYIYIHVFIYTYIYIYICIFIYLFICLVLWATQPNLVLKIEKVYNLSITRTMCLW